MATQSSIVAWRIPWTEEPCRLQFKRLQSWTGPRDFHHHLCFGGEAPLRTVFWPGESHGWRSLVGYSPRGCKESETTERLHFHFL